MKIIDLLNKIANGEEVPSEIKYNNLIYWYDETDDNEFARYRDIHGEWLFADAYLNDEVEILEEKKKIPEKIEEKEIEVSMAIGEQICANKINEIIDYLKSKGDE